MSDVRITKAGGHWVVRIGGAVIGETDGALRLSEGALPEVIYVPREDMGMAFFDRSDTRTHCPKKGDATYYSFVSPEGRVDDVAWSYEEPLPGAEAIKGYLAFYEDKAHVEEL